MTDPLPLPGSPAPAPPAATAVPKPKRELTPAQAANFARGRAIRTANIEAAKKAKLAKAGSGPGPLPTQTLAHPPAPDPKTTTPTAPGAVLPASGRRFLIFDNWGAPVPPAASTAVSGGVTTPPGPKLGFLDRLLNLNLGKNKP